MQNGLFLYASGVFVIFLIGLNQHLVSDYKLDHDTVSYIVLLILIVKIFVYFSIESLLMFHYCKFIFTPWLVYAFYIIYVVACQAIANKANVVYEYFMSNRFGSVENMSRNGEQYLFSYIKLNNIFYLRLFSLFVILVFFVFKLVKFFTYDLYYANGFRKKKMLKF